MINISINGRLIDAIYALVTSMTAGVPEAAPAIVEVPETAPVEMPEAAPVVGLKTVDDLRGHLRQVAAAKGAEPVAAGRARKKADPREHVAVTRPEPVEAKLEPIKAVEAQLEPIKAVETPAPKAPAPVALDSADDWPTTLTKPPSWDYDGQGASWRAANQIGTAELGAAIQRVYIDHADIIKMPSVRVAMSKLGVSGWWGCVAKNIADARDASNKPLDITPKREAKND